MEMDYEQIEYQEKNMKLKRESNPIVELQINYPDNPFSEMIETFSDHRKNTYFKEIKNSIKDESTMRAMLKKKQQLNCKQYQHR